jgi:hypothetical protein
MNKRQRKMLRDLMGLCNELGGSLDYTATHYNKLRDRQKALMDCSLVIYAVLTDNPNNEFSADDYENAKQSLEKIRMLTKIIYPDRKGEIDQRLSKE